jgi:hypothetical protein
MMEQTLRAAVSAALHVACQGGGSEGGGIRSGTDLELENNCCYTLRYGGGEYPLLPCAVLTF